MSAYKERTLTRVEEALEELRESLGKDVPAEVLAALEAWNAQVIEEARRGLARPHWLMSRSFGAKTKEYKERGKIFAVVGFQYRSKSKRDPGYYGRFHEGGWAPRGHKVTAPAKFIRRAKEKYLPLLQEELKKILERFPE